MIVFEIYLEIIGRNQYIMFTGEQSLIEEGSEDAA